MKKKGTEGCHLTFSADASIDWETDALDAVAVVVAAAVVVVAVLSTDNYPSKLAPKGFRVHLPRQFVSSQHPRHSPVAAEVLAAAAVVVVPAV